MGFACSLFDRVCFLQVLQLPPASKDEQIGSYLILYLSPSVQETNVGKIRWISIKMMLVGWHGFSGSYGFSGQQKIKVIKIRNLKSNIADATNLK